MREIHNQKNLVNGSEIPLGLGMALAENLPAMNHFASLSPTAQQQVIEHTHAVRSKQEMRAYVDSLVQNTPQ